EQILSGKRHAAFGRLPVIGGDMDKNSAAFTGNDRGVVVSDRDNEVVYVVLAPELFMRILIRQFYRPVVVRAFGVIAPAVIFGNSFKRQAAFGRVDAVASVPAI